MRRWGLIAACLLAVAAAMLSARPRTREAHTCTATDRHFIRTARVAVDVKRLDSSGGELSRADAIASAYRLRRTGPSDPSLRQARLLLSAMLVEHGHARYGRAERLESAAHDVLAAVAAPLRDKGCDVELLLVPA